MVASHAIATGKELAELNIPEQKFNIKTKQGKNGKAVPDFQRVKVMDTTTGETKECNAVYDESGISVVDNGTAKRKSGAAYTVFVPGQARGRNFMSLDKAITYATQVKNDIALDMARDNMKVEFISKMVEKDYGGANIICVKTAAEAVDAAKKRGYDVTQSGAYDAGRAGWHLPDGTVVLVRDNISSPQQAERLLRHENIGHSDEMMKDKWLNAGEKSEIGELRDENLGRAKKVGPILASEEERIKRESVANTIQENRHVPTMGDRVIHGIREALRKVGLNLNENDVDMDVVAAGVEKAMRKSTDGSYVSVEAVPLSELVQIVAEAKKAKRQKKAAKATANAETKTTQTATATAAAEESARNSATPQESATAETTAAPQGQTNENAAPQEEARDNARAPQDGEALQEEGIANDFENQRPNTGKEKPNETRTNANEESAQPQSAEAQQGTQAEKLEGHAAAEGVVNTAPKSKLTPEQQERVSVMRSDAELMKLYKAARKEKDATKRAALIKEFNERSDALWDAHQKAKAAASANEVDFDKESTVLSGDEVRKGMPGYDAKDWRTHVDKSGYVAPRMEAQFQHLLKTRKGKGNGTVVFLAGGNGSGKSTVAKKLKGKPDFTIDSTLGNLDVARKQINTILENGEKPVIAFVYRSPEQALEGIKGRVNNGGHSVSPLSFANSHTKARENLRLLSDEFGDKIDVRIYDNSVKGSPRISLEQLEQKEKVSHEELRKRADEAFGRYGSQPQGGLAGQSHASSVTRSGGKSEGSEGRGENGGRDKPVRNVAGTRESRSDEEARAVAKESAADNGYAAWLNKYRLKDTPARRKEYESKKVASVKPSAAPKAEAKAAAEEVVPKAVAPKEDTPKTEAPKAATPKATTTPKASGKADAKAEVIKDFLGDKNNRPWSQKPYHDKEKGVVVALDGHVMLVTKHGFDPNAENDEKFPKYEKLLPSKDNNYYSPETKKIDIDKLLDICKKAVRLGNDRKNTSASVLLKLNGLYRIYSAQVLSKALKAMKAYGINEISEHYTHPGWIFARNDEATIMTLPMSVEGSNSTFKELPSVYRGEKIDTLAFDGETGRIAFAPKREVTEEMVKAHEGTTKGEVLKRQLAKENEIEALIEETKKAENSKSDNAPAKKADEGEGKALGPKKDAARPAPATPAPKTEEAAKPSENKRTQQVVNATAETPANAAYEAWLKKYSLKDTPAHRAEFEKKNGQEGAAKANEPKAKSKAIGNAVVSQEKAKENTTSQKKVAPQAQTKAPAPTRAEAVAAMKVLGMDAGLPDAQLKAKVREWERHASDERVAKRLAAAKTILADRAAKGKAELTDEDKMEKALTEAARRKGKFDFDSPEYARKGKNFSLARPVERRKDLIAIHNVDKDAVRSVLDLGGFAMPSIAIVKDKQGHSSFGDVSVLFGRETIDPKRSVYNAIYSHDAWTPTFPDIELKIDTKKVEEVSERLFKSVPEDVKKAMKFSPNEYMFAYSDGITEQFNRMRGDSSAATAYGYKPIMKAAYLAAKGEKIEALSDQYKMEDALNKRVDSSDPAYRDWVNKQYGDVVLARGFHKQEDHFTPRGNRKSWNALHAPVTIDNAVKLMRTKQREQGAGFIRTPYHMSAKKYASIKEVIENESKLRALSDEEFEALKKSLEESIAESFGKYSDTKERTTILDFEADDVIFDAWESSRNNFEKFKNEITTRGYTPSEELAKEIFDKLHSMEDMNTKFFEAKPRRAVRLNETRAWIVPESMNAADKQLLKDHGQNVYTYKDKDEADRLRVVNKAADDTEVRFDSPEYARKEGVTEDDIRLSVQKANIKAMLAPFNEAKGKTREQIDKEYSHEQKEIATLPSGLDLPKQLKVESPVVKSAQAYILNHLLNQPGHEFAYSAEDAKRVIGLIAPTSDIRMVPQRNYLSLAFIDKNPNGGWDCIVIAPRSGQFYIFKTMFGQTRKPYQDKAKERQSVSVRRSEAANRLIRGDLSSIRDFPETSNSIPYSDAGTQEESADSAKNNKGGTDIDFDSPEYSRSAEERAEEIKSYTQRYYSRHKGLKRLEKPTAEDFMDAAEGRWSKFRRAVQDKNLVIRELEERLGITDKKKSVYYAKDREFGLNEWQLDALDREFIQPIFEKLAATGAGQQDLDLYLMARHAPSRNAILRTRGVENGSGMSDAEAADVLKHFNEIGIADEFDEIAKMVYAMNEQALKRRVDSGRMSADEAAKLRRQFKDYVPLRTDMENDERDAHNTYSSGWHLNEFHMAKGRKTLADSPLSWSIVQAERSIKDANANKTRQVAADLVRTAAKMGHSIGEIIPGRQVKHRWAFQLGTEVLTLEELRDRPDLIFFKEDGKLKAIRMNTGEHGLGNTFAKAVTDKDLARFNKWFEWVPKVTRFFSAMRTQYVPTFIIRNMRADHIEVLLNSLTERGIKGGAEFFGRLVKCEVQNAKDVRDFFGRGELRGRMKEFVENGGLTGGGMSAEGFTEVEKRLVATLKDAKRNPAMKAVGALGDLISWLNACAEYNTRVAVFSALREQGVSVEDAVSYARDATVNFNRKGFLTPYINAAYMFSNASIQGLGRAFKPFREHPKRAMGTLGALFLLGMIQGFIDNFVGRDDDDDKKKEDEEVKPQATGLSNVRNLSEYSKQSEVSFPMGKSGLMLKARVRNPFALPIYLGRKAAEYITGQTNAKKAVSDLASAVGGFVTEPVGGNGLGSVSEALQTLAPTMIDPFVQWATGTDFAGTPRVKRNFSDYKPDSYNGRNATPAPYKWLAQSLNSLSGGNEFRKGALDTAPENWKLLVETALGGVLTDIGRTFSTVQDAWQAANGEKPDQVMRDIPFVRDWVTNYPDVRNRYYEILKEYEADKAEFKGLEKDGKSDAEINAFADTYKWVEDSDLDEVQKNIKNLGKEIQELKRQDKEQKDGKQEEQKDIRELERDQLALMEYFVRQMDFYRREEWAKKTYKAK